MKPYPLERHDGIIDYAVKNRTLVYNSESVCGTVERFEQDGLGWLLVNSTLMYEGDCTDHIYNLKQNDTIVLLIDPGQEIDGLCPVAIMETIDGKVLYRSPSYSGKIPEVIIKIFRQRIK